MDERTTEQPGRVLTCPVANHSGTVRLKPLTFPLFWTWNQALDQLPEEEPDEEPDQKKKPGKVNVYQQFHVMLPAVCACVAEWNLEGFDKAMSYETFPAEKINSRLAVIGWLVAEINRGFFGSGEQHPNG